jgi:hypothetical protein
MTGVSAASMARGWTCSMRGALLTTVWFSFVFPYNKRRSNIQKSCKLLRSTKTFVFQVFALSFECACLLRLRRRVLTVGFTADPRLTGTGFLKEGDPL